MFVIPVLVPGGEFFDVLVLLDDAELQRARDRVPHGIEIKDFPEYADLRLRNVIVASESRANVQGLLAELRAQGCEPSAGFEREPGP